MDLYSTFDRMSPSVLFCSVRLAVFELSHAKHVMTVENKESLFVSRCCTSGKGRLTNEPISNARAQPLFCQLNLLFGDVLAVVV